MYQKNPYLDELQRQAMASQMPQQPMFQMPQGNLGLSAGLSSPVLPTVNGVPVEDLTSKFDSSLGTTTKEKSPSSRFSSVRKAGTGGIMSEPMPSQPLGLLQTPKYQAPQQPMQMPARPQMSPYMQTLQNMIMGRYG